MLASIVLGVLLQQPARIQAWNPDPSVVITLPKVEVDWELAKQLGISALIRLNDGPASNVTLTFFARKGKTFEQHIADSHRLLIQALPDKTAEPIDEATLAKHFLGVGVTMKAFAYPNGMPKEGASRSICDTVAVHLETTGGFWTVSLNGNAGETNALWGVLEKFMMDVKIERIDGLARVGA